MSTICEKERTAGAAPDADARMREVPSVRRAAAMLWHLGRHTEGLSLSRIAHDLGVLPSTCLHILRELVAAKLVAHDPEAKLYRLGSGVLTLARQLTHQSRFVQVTQSVLHRLSREFQVGASAQERDGDDLVVVAAVSVLPGDMVSPGARTTLFTSASGRLMAAFNDFMVAELKQRFTRARWQDAPSVEEWLKEVRFAGRAGYAVDEGRFRKGITTIAGPILNLEGYVDRAISVTAVSAQLDRGTRKQLAAAIRKAAAEVTKALN